MSFDVSKYIQVFKSRRVAAVLLFGFSSGLPLALTSGTLQAWMATAGVDLRTIGVFALVGLPYTLKFFWAPLMDRFIPPLLGRRRGWALITQLALMAGIIAMAFSSPHQTLIMGMFAVVVAFISASQDIVIDAYRTDVLHEKERGVGAATFVLGYRIAMLASGAFALVLSDQIGWRNTYLIMAGLLSIGILTSLFSPEPEERVVPPRSLEEAVWNPLKDLLSRRAIHILLLLIVLYKLGDAYAGSMTTAFLIRGVGFTATDVGTINKGLGLVSLILGAMFGGALMIRLGLYKSLFLFGVLQAISNLSFMVLAALGKSYPMMVFAVAFENISSGMGTSAFVALLMTLCNQRYSATQYALLSSLAALGKYIVGPTAGFLVEQIGWVSFFFITTVSALPGLILLWWLRHSLSSLQIEPIKR